MSHVPCLNLSSESDTHRWLGTWLSQCQGVVLVDALHMEVFCEGQRSWVTTLSNCISRHESEASSMHLRPSSPGRDALAAFTEDSGHRQSQPGRIQCSLFNTLVTSFLNLSVTRWQGLSLFGLFTPPTIGHPAGLSQCPILPGGILYLHCLPVLAGE